MSYKLPDLVDCGLSSAGFSLRGLDFARTKIGRLKPTPQKTPGIYPGRIFQFRRIRFVKTGEMPAYAFAAALRPLTAMLNRDL
jgi:hypothetical protein